MLNFLKFKKIIHSKMSFKESAFGWDGLSTFIFSNILLLVTLGLAFLWLFWQTLKTALFSRIEANKEAAAEATTVAAIESVKSQTILIAGLCLENNQPTDEFKCRLNRALLLLKKSMVHKSMARTTAEEQIQIIILGGFTGNNRISEARAGADYLIAQGIDAAWIVIEEQSRHTLENMQNARVLLLNKLVTQRFKQLSAPVIISSRYHLYRVLTLARGLQMTLQPVAAEDRFTLSIISLLRLLKEAYYLHWYWSGKLWVFITANKNSRARIT